MLRVSLQSTRRGVLRGLSISAPLAALGSSTHHTARVITCLATRHRLSVSCSTSPTPLCSASASAACITVEQRRLVRVDGPRREKTTFGGNNQVPEADPEAEDLYKRLGLDKTASSEQIKKNFLILAKLHHPDANNNSLESSRIFKRLKQANEVLKDSDQRRVYDSTGKAEEPWAKYTGGRKRYNVTYEHAWYASRGAEDSGTVNVNIPPFIIVLTFAAFLLLFVSLALGATEGGIFRSLVRFFAVLGFISVLPRLPAAAVIYYMYAMPSRIVEPWKNDVSLIMTVYPPPDPKLLPSRVVAMSGVPADVAATHKIVATARVVRPITADVAAESQLEPHTVASKAGVMSVSLPGELLGSRGTNGTLTRVVYPQGSEVSVSVALKDTNDNDVVVRIVRFRATE